MIGEYILKIQENPLIRDLIIEGLSLARTQKEEFKSILDSNNDDINILFLNIRKIFLTIKFTYMVGPPGL